MAKSPLRLIALGIIALVAVFGWFGEVVSAQSCSSLSETGGVDCVAAFNGGTYQQLLAYTTNGTTTTTMFLGINFLNDSTAENEMLQSTSISCSIANMSFVFPLDSQSGWQYIPIPATSSGTFYFELRMELATLNCSQEQLCELHYNFTWTTNVVSSDSELVLPLETQNTYALLQPDPSAQFIHLNLSRPGNCTDIPTAYVRVYFGNPLTYFNDSRTHEPNATATFCNQANIALTSPSPPEEGGWNGTLVFVQIIPNGQDGQGSTVNLTFVTMPTGTSFGSWFPAPAIFLFAIFVSCVIIGFLPRMTRNHSILSNEAQTIYTPLRGSSFSEIERVSDLPRVIRGRSRNSYSRIDWSIITFAIAIFFIVPALQMIDGSLTEYFYDGDRDVCYFNELCQCPVFLGGKVVWAFNNVASNAAYVAVGIVLIGHFLYIQKKWPRVGPSNPSILYAVALALICEGVCSALYHLCPSPRNFQVDTTFMFVITLLSIAETVRKHLGDLSPVKATAILSLLILLNLIGFVYWTTKPTAFLIFFALVVLVAYARIFYLLYAFKANWTYYIPNVIGAILAIVIPCLVRRFSPNFSAANTLLMTIIFLGVIAQISDVVRVSNTAWRASRWRHLPFFTLWGVLSLCAIICWIVAVHFFFQAVTDKDETPSLSRSSNAACTLGWYDLHDIWHFVGALALFFQTLLAFHFQFPRLNDNLNESSDMIAHNLKAAAAAEDNYEPEEADSEINS